MIKTFKFIFLFLLGSIVLVSCNKQEATAKATTTKGKSPSSTPYEIGSCFDKVVSPYVYQIAQVEGSNIFYFALGKADKEILSASADSLFKGEDPYQMIDCP